MITYTQQKTKKTNTLPLLPIIGDAIIDYLKNGRLDSDCDNVFIRHIPVSYTHLTQQIFALLLTMPTRSQ